MKLSFFLVVCFSLLFGCYNKKRNCEDFHKGTFQFETLINGELTKTTFVRSDSLEVDYFSGKTDTSSVRWINRCECILRKLHPKSRAETKAIHMKILTTDEDVYTFEYALVGTTNKQRGAAKKIK